MSGDAATESGPPARSAPVQHSDLEDGYVAAWEEWDASGERAAWEATVGDELTDTPG